MNNECHRYDSEKCGHGCTECEIPFDTGRVYICSKCGERLDEKHTLETAYPHWHDQPKIIGWVEELRKERNEPPKPVNRYHLCYEYGRCIGQPVACEQIACGPMHPETDQEYFIHWIGGSMKVNSRR